MSDYVTAAEAADLLGVSDTHVRRHIQAGTVDAKKVKGRWSIARGDLEGLDLTGPPNERQTNERQDGGATEQPDERTTRQTNDRTNDRRTNDRWRDDLLAQVARLEADKVAAEERTREVREEMGLRIEASKARVIDLERAATVREGRIVDMEASHATVVSELRGQVAVLEAKVRETLEAHTEKLGDLASDIAELANSKAQMELRVSELEPVASQVPMLQAAVEEKDAVLSERERQLEVREHELTAVREDIEAIASRPVTGPMFRLLTKKKLRI